MDYTPPQNQKGQPSGNVENVRKILEKERGVEHELNANASCDFDGDDADRLATETVSGDLSMAALREMLAPLEQPSYSACTDMDIC